MWKQQIDKAGSANDAIMDPFYKALSLFRLRKYEECIELLNKYPSLQGAWELKMRSMTQKVYVDDIEAEEDAVTGSIDCQLILCCKFFQLSYLRFARQKEKFWLHVISFFLQRS